MVRRVSIPGADELFRQTDEGAPADPGETAAPAVPGTPRGPVDGAAGGPTEPPRSPVPAQSRRSRRSSGPRAPEERTPSGRVRHDEKMTVYVTAEELTEIEVARLQLRSQHGLVVDRGRLVREALAMALRDLETRGDDAELVRRLSTA